MFHAELGGQVDRMHFYFFDDFVSVRQLLIYRFPVSLSKGNLISGVVNFERDSLFLKLFSKLP